jgi:hypothetical protein
MALKETDGLTARFLHPRFPPTGMNLKLLKAKLERNHRPIGARTMMSIGTGRRRAEFSRPSLYLARR